jgi:hypothetical protein
MEQKTFTAPFEFKEDGQPGEFKAVFATFNVNDLHGDWTIPGAFDEQNVVIEPWNHGYELPAGKGVIKSNDREAWIEGQFFLDTQTGKDNYTTVKNLGPIAEWSYTFDILEAETADPAQYGGADRILKKMDVVGVSPVTRGAGINTRTTQIKNAGKTGDDDNNESSNGDQAGNGASSVDDTLNTRVKLAKLSTIATLTGVKNV